MIMDKVNSLMTAYRAGELGGEKMPEHENPGLEPGCRLNYMYFYTADGAELPEKFLCFVGMRESDVQRAP